MGTIKAVCSAVLVTLATCITIPVGISIISKYDGKDKIQDSKIINQTNYNFKPSNLTPTGQKTPSQPKQIQNVNLPVLREEANFKQLKEFKALFEYWSNVLKYDVPSGEEIDKKVESDLSDDKWFEAHPELLHADQSTINQRFYEDLRAAKVQQLIKVKKGVCRHFTQLLIEESHKIGFETYYLSNQKHAANLYKAYGKWYVADLTNRIDNDDYEQNEWLFKAPLDDYLKKLMHVKSEADRKNIIIRTASGSIPLDEFLSTH